MSENAQSEFTLEQLRAMVDTPMLAAHLPDYYAAVQQLFAVLTERPRVTTDGGEVKREECEYRDDQIFDAICDGEALVVEHLGREGLRQNGLIAAIATGMYKQFVRGYEQAKEDAAQIAGEEKRRGLLNMADKEDAEYDNGYSEAAQEIERRTRALTPSPEAAEGEK